VDYASNSKKSEQEGKPGKQIEKVVTGDVVQRQKTLGQKFKGVFFGGEFRSAARYIAADVLLPAFRNLIVDASTKGIERVIYGETSHASRRRTEYRPRVQYNNPINVDRRHARVPLPDQPPSGYRQNRHEGSDIILSSREEAELVLERLIDIIDKYDVASLADLYDLVGLPTNHVDNKWGWSYLSECSVNQVRDGWLIDLPPLEPI
jgi:hypothetical protein